MSTQSPVSHATGLYLAFLQLIFTLCWTVYAIFLPKLAASVGIAATSVILILMLDQAVFTIFDVATGVAADRMSRVIGQLGRIVAIVTIVSCLAFVALPFIAGNLPGTVGIALFFACTIIWTTTSSALRAPPLMLLGKYAAKPSIPYLSSLALLGYGLAGAAGPYLALNLRDMDPRLPFVLSSVVLVLTTFGLAHVERLLAKDAPKAAPAPKTPATAVSATRMVFAFAMVVLALGYQTHFALNSAGLFRRFTTDIDHLMPIFWVGFNIAMFPATLLVKRYGGFAVMGLFGVIGGLSIVAAEFANGLNFLIAAQFAAGASWGCMLMAAFMAAFNSGEGGAEGKMVGVLFSALALATFLRMGAVAAGLNRDASWTAILQWAPVVCWTIAGAALLWLAFGYLRRWMAQPA